MTNHTLKSITQKWNAFTQNGGKPIRFDLAETDSIGKAMENFLNQFPCSIEAVATGIIDNNVCFAYIDVGYGKTVECFSACDHHNIIITVDGEEHFISVIR